MKSLRLLTLAALGLVSLAACGGGNPSSQAPASSAAPQSSAQPSSAAPQSSTAPAGTPVKVGLICLHDENSTYDANFINALAEAVENLGDKVVFESNCLLTGIDENEECYEAARDLVEKGCNVIFADSFGHDAYMLQAAKEFPNVQFCHATGTKTTVNSEVKNFHNAFASIYEGRFMAGYAAGLKLANQHFNDKNDPVKVGYVGAYPYAEVKSGYTSWFLGVRQALEDLDKDSSKVTMSVKFTNDWYAPVPEANAAEALINEGCVLISQHADSMGAPGTCEANGIPNITYNIETKDECPETYLGYSRINWAPYYEAVVNAVYNGTAIEGEVNQNWTGTIATGSVEFNVNYENLAEGATLETYKTMLNTMLTKITEGNYQIFDCAKFQLASAPVGGSIDEDGHLMSYLADVIDDGTFTGDTEVVVIDGLHRYFAESKFRSAPYFDLDIVGINL